MGGKASRKKGHSFERRVARWLRDTLGLGDFWRVTSETQQGNSGDVKDRAGSPCPLVVQTKIGKRPNPMKALREACDAAEPGEIPLAIVHIDGGEQAVLMRPEHMAVIFTALGWTPEEGMEGWEVVREKLAFYFDKHPELVGEKLSL